MKIYIPTFRRVDNQITFNNLPDDVKENVILGRLVPAGTGFKAFNSTSMLNISLA